MGGEQLTGQRKRSGGNGNRRWLLQVHNQLYKGVRLSYHRPLKFKSVFIPATVSFPSPSATVPKHAQSRRQYRTSLSQDPSPPSSTPSDPPIPFLGLSYSNDDKNVTKPSNCQTQDGENAPRPFFPHSMIARIQVKVMRISQWAVSNRKQTFATMPS